MSLSFLSLLKAGLKGGVIAAIINLVLFEFSARVFGLEFNVVMSGRPDKVFELPVIFASIIPSIVASVLFYFLIKKTSNPERIFKVIALVFLIFSFSGPFQGSDSASVRLILILMHIVVAVSVVRSLISTRTSEQPIASV